MSAVNEKKVTEEGLGEVAKSIKEAADSLRFATIALRAAYCESKSENELFKELRNSAVNNAYVYREKLLPLAEACVNNMKQFFDYYVALSYEEWKEVTKDLAKEAKSYADQAAALKLAHELLASDFKALEDKSKEVKESLKLEKDLYEKTAESSESASNWLSFGYDLLIVFPVARLAADQFFDLGGIVEGSKAKAIHDKAQVDITEAAIRLLDTALVNCFTNFAKAMDNLSGFFNLLSYECDSFAKKEESTREKEEGSAKKIHFTLCKKKGKDIQEKCDLFLVMIPGASSDLLAINFTHDKNYVSKWFESKKTNDSDLKSIMKQAFAASLKLIKSIIDTE